MKSREASGVLPSGFVKFAEMPAPCTSPTKASDTAGMINAGTNRRSGSSGVGSEWGTMPRSPSVATPLQPAQNAAAEVTMTATTSPIAPRRVRSSSTISTIVTTPTNRVRPSSRPGWIRVLNARTSRLSPDALYPVRFAS